MQPTDTAGASISDGQQSVARIPRPMNAWLLYRSESVRLLKSGNPEIKRQQQGQLSKVIAEKWRNEAPETKRLFEARAEQLKNEHRLQHPSYRFQPLLKTSRKNAATRTATANQSSAKAGPSNSASDSRSTDSIGSPARSPGVPLQTFQSYQQGHSSQDRNAPKLTQQTTSAVASTSRTIYDNTLKNSGSARQQIRPESVETSFARGGNQEWRTAPQGTNQSLTPYADWPPQQQRVTSPNEENWSTGAQFLSRPPSASEWRQIPNSAATQPSTGSSSNEFSVLPAGSHVQQYQMAQSAPYYQNRFGSLESDELHRPSTAPLHAQQHYPPPIQLQPGYQISSQTPAGYPPALHPMDRMAHSPHSTHSNLPNHEFNPAYYQPPNLPPNQFQPHFAQNYPPAHFQRQGYNPYNEQQYLSQQTYPNSREGQTPTHRDVDRRNYATTDEGDASRDQTSWEGGATDSHIHRQY